MNDILGIGFLITLGLVGLGITVINLSRRKW